MSSEKPPLNVELTWEGDLRFRARSKTAEVVLDGDGHAGPSPMQSLAFALASCVGMDVVFMLQKGRHRPTAVGLEVAGVRAAETPHRFVSIEIRIVVDGGVPEAAVRRAVDLSHEKYCSVWHSMRQDIALTIKVESRP
jgi:putative redox protein